jgi:Protein of unknown function (DUF1588)
LAGLAQTNRTSATLRGKFVQERLLCRSIPAPPPSVDTTLPTTANGTTRRQQLEDHMRNPSCAGCHSQMDPIGFGFEQFDALGVERELDNGVPIDASGVFQGQTFTGAQALSALVRDDAANEPCLAQNLWQHALGNQPAALRAPLVLALVQAFRGGGGGAAALFRAVALRDEFARTSDVP